MIIALTSGKPPDPDAVPKQDPLSDLEPLFPELKGRFPVTSSKADVANRTETILSVFFAASITRHVCSVSEKATQKNLQIPCISALLVLRLLFFRHFYQEIYNHRDEEYNCSDTTRSFAFVIRNFCNFPSHDLLLSSKIRNFGLLKFA